MKSWALAVLVLLLGCSAEPLASAYSGLRTNRAFVIDVWDTEKGLPQNEVHSILQTHDGYLWLGTPSGLVRFDGIGFTILDESNTPGLKSSNILSLFEDSRRNLWIGTANAGVVLMQDGRLTALGIGEGSRGGRVAAACEDPSGAVWLHLVNGQLWRYQRGQTNLFVFGAGQVTDYRGLILEQSGPLWLGTDRSLAAVNWRAATNGAGLPVEQTINLVKLDFLLASREGGYWRMADGRIEKWRANRDRPDLSWRWYPWMEPSSGFVRLSTACEDLEGNLIVGTRGAGVFWFNAHGEATRIASADHGLSNDYVSALCMDREGALWVGTDGGGLNRIKRPLFHVLEPSRGLVVQSVAEDAQGGLWVGYNASPLGYWRDGVHTSGKSPVRIVLADRQQRVWGGTWGAGLLQIQTNRLRDVPGFPASLQYISAIYQDRRDWLWVGSDTGLARWDQQEWKTFTTRDGLSSNLIQAIADDPEGNIWIGTEGGGLNRWRGSQFITFRKQQNTLPSDNVSALYVDDEGVLWIGTDGGGLARLHRGQWARYTRDDGLVSNSIGYIIDDTHGHLWIGSSGGLMRASKQDLSQFARGETNFVAFRVYGRPDGLPIRECSFGTQPGPTRARDGTLWFPTIHGLAAVDPAHLRPNTNPPPVRIEAVLIDGRPVLENKLRRTLPDSIGVPPGKERIEFQFSSLNLSAPERARFKYRLEGYQSSWTDVTDTRVAYHNLPPAEYRFQVTACNEDGVWNPVGAALGIRITPPFWRTWWFLSGAALGLLGSITAGVHYLSTQRLQRQVLRLRQQEALERERSRIARDIHDQLGASLTQVALLGELVQGDKDAPEEVEEHARQISQTARDTTRVLDEIVWAVNPANDTLDGLVTYICKNTQEYLTVAGLHYRFDVPGQLPATPVPPEVRHNVFLACKEAVTNVVKHARASAVWVRLRLQPSAFVLEIEDDGRGLAGLDEKAAQTRNGLRNMRKRMEEIGGDFGFGPAPNRGTLVRFTVPLARREN